MMLIAGMIRLALKRLRSRLGLSVLSLFGVILAVGMVTSIPIFTQAVSFVVLRNELADLGGLAGRPPFAVRFYFISSAKQPFSLASVLDMEATVARMLSAKVGLPIKQRITAVETFPLTLRSAPGSKLYVDHANAGLGHVTIDVIASISQHINVYEGEQFGEVTRGERIGVWVNKALKDKMGLRVNEEYDLAAQGASDAIRVYIAGFWRARDSHDPYWYQNPDTIMAEVFLVSQPIFESAVQPRLPEQSGFCSWYFILDEQALGIDRADSSAAGLAGSINALGAMLPGMRMDYSPLQPLQRYIQRRALLSALLTGFSLPAIGLLLYFLMLVSTTTVRFQAEEAAILASRGAGSTYITGVSAIETLLLIGAGVPLGVMLGYALAYAMGNTMSFLEFASRPPLPVSLTGIDGRMLAVSILMLLGARLLPAWQSAQASIVGALRERSRLIGNSVRAKLALDLTLIVISLYAYQHLKARGTLGIIGWEPSGDPFRDPLLLLAPSLFTFTTCLVLAHLFPVLLRPLDALGGHLPFPGYIGLRQLLRQSEQYTSALFLVMVCLSLGAFYSSLALSLDQWLTDHVYYQAGADYTFELGIRIVGGESPDVNPQDRRIVIDGSWLMPASDYLEIPGVVAATRVGVFDASATQSRQGKQRFIGVDRLDFPGVAFFRPDFAAAPLGELMNRLGMYPNGILVSQSFLKSNNLAEGQRLDLEVKTNSTAQKASFVIVGTFQNFPTVYPQQGDAFVGNLDYLFQQIGGIAQHSIWLQTAPDADSTAIRTRIAAMNVKVERAVDTRFNIVKDQDRVERIGLFGMLSIGFLSGTILSGVGLLVYTYASLQGRLGQLSVLRAIGCQVSDILMMVSIEYFTVIAYGVVTGVAAGIASSYLFVPFFQFSSDPATALPPFLLQIAWGKTAAIAIIFAVALVVSQLVILYNLTRKEFFQMLRMGQHQ